MDYYAVISLLLFMSMFLFALSIYAFIDNSTKHQKIINKIRRADEEMALTESAGKGLPSKNDGNDYFTQLMGFLGEQAGLSKKDLSHVRLKLIRAGYRRAGAVSVYFGLKVLAAVVVPLVLFTFSLMAAKFITPFLVIIIMALGALEGFYIPDFILRIKTAARQQTIMEGLPDALDLMVVCTEAGMGIDAAMLRVGEEMKLNNKTLSEEIRILNLEMQAGKGRAAALRDLSLRTNVEEVNGLTTLLIQTERFGTGVAQALRTHSEFMRTRRYQKSEETAAKLPVKLLIPLIFFIFPAMFITIIGPSAIRIMRAFTSMGNH